MLQPWTDALQALEQALPGLQRQVRLEEEQLDIAAVVQEWGALAATKQQCYQALFQAVASLHQCYEALIAAHVEQEQAVSRLPGGVRERLSFPDTGSFARNFETRSGWHLEDLEAPTHAKVQAVLDVDGGLQPLNPRMIHRFLQEAAQWNQRY